MPINILSQNGQMVRKPTLTAAFTDADTAGKTVVITGPVTASTMDTGGRSLEIKQGGVITIPTGVTLTINGPFQCGLFQCFSGAGSVSFTCDIIINPQWFYDGAGDYSEAINKAIQSADALQEIKLPSGDVPIAGAGTEMILIDRMIKFSGHGINGTRLVVSQTDTGGSTDIIRIVPNMAAGYGNGLGLYIGDFSIRSDAPRGAHGIHFDTSSDVDMIIAESVVERVWVDQLFGYGFYQTDHASSIDGYFNSTIRNSVFFGGITMSRMGDTNRIENNFLRGDGFGLDITMTDGASVASITGNVVTSASGSIFRNAGSLIIERNQFEGQVANTNPQGALLSLLGTDAYLPIPVVKNNKFYHRVDYDAIHVYVDKAYAPQFSGNYHTLERDGVLGIAQCCYYITSNCVGANIGDNFIVKDATPSYILWRNMLDDQSTYPSVIIDLGVGSVGLPKVLTLENGWSPYEILPTVERTSQEWVCLNGALSAGTTKASGTTIFTLPVGFRPGYPTNIQVNTSNSVTGYPIARINIATDGTVKIYDNDTNILTILLYGVMFKSAN